MLHRHSPASRSRGFTLLELLVVIAILAILCGMLLSAVQQVRASAQRVHCENNLKQLGLGLCHYEKMFGAFPACSSSRKPPYYTWYCEVLPFLDQNTLHFDLKRSWYQGNNLKVARTPVPLFYCPATPETDRIDPLHRNAAVSDYPATGDVQTAIYKRNKLPVPADINGALNRFGRTRAAAITDGLSQTILLSEDAARPQLWRAGKMIPGGKIDAAGWAVPEHEITISGWNSSGTGVGTGVINCTNDNEIYSFHRGGANAVFADGSVHFILSSIADYTLAALVTRAGEEPYAFDY